MNINHINYYCQNY